MIDNDCGDSFSFGLKDFNSYLLQKKVNILIFLQHSYLKDPENLYRNY
jgi:hypothetical protein